MPPLSCPICRQTPAVEPYAYGPGWQILCRDCYDGTEDADPAARLNAVCDTREDTIAQWNDGVEMNTDEVLCRECSVVLTIDETYADDDPICDRCLEGEPESGVLSHARDCNLDHEDTP